MTPAARLQAAIDILEHILNGAAAEQALTTWARGNRFAGSGDRAAIRDHVFDCLRCKRSFAHVGGAETGRGLVLGLLRARGMDPETVFTGQGYAPSPLLPDESLPAVSPMPDNVALDCPDWIAPDLQVSLDDQFRPVLQALQHRAPVFLRVNLARGTRATAAARLAQEGIGTRPHPLAETALEVTENARRVRQSSAFMDGLVELQDAASQAVIQALPIPDGADVLDYCAGGGGKALALAARGAQVTAHDADPARMKDIPARAGRAGVTIDMTHAPQGRFDLVVLDVPCSGSGSWRRAPAGKWTMNRAMLNSLLQVQADILDKAPDHLRPGGVLGYMTCSLLMSENTQQITRFLDREPAFRLVSQQQFTPLDGGDGFFLAVLQHCG
ncbi:RsmB/NOP family class I SAM-dependent RNA methyltransferase [Roseinatronobacter alkalisoli]|uniref:RsmB/NOP family class I SAM-dependent RNA methyltransferase n=1 Tax=Roseinatronobacter alkalisoli TaxID=3028235 RepID=A0ABT5TD02_9RHOB|nr:RsmB/NOP family class I SAM-dependent RNA methyltransferase [Roseinatronobacter sp. HJB301]MDD7971793.1 RsmB/NOP family class I SAM-dependent RNA methyltransferase [Roseinatronobacter sp. HJB301]